MNTDTTLSKNHSEYSFTCDLDRPRAKSILILVFSFLLSAPIFLAAGSRGIMLGTETFKNPPGVQNFPVSILAVIFVILLWMKQKFEIDTPLKVSSFNKLIAAFIFFNLISFLVGSTFRGFNIFNLLFFLQMIGPTFAFLIGLNLIDNFWQAKTAIFTIVFTFASFMGLVSVLTFFEKGAASAIGGPFIKHIWTLGLYQMSNYYQSISAITLGLALTLFFTFGLDTSKGIKLSLLLSLLAICNALLSFKREGVVTAVTIVFILLILSKDTPIYRKVFFLATLAIATILVSHYYGSHALGAIRRGSIDPRSNRTAIWLRNLNEHIFSNPLFGRGFATFGQKGSLMRGLGGAHNQYLGIWKKSGLFPFITFIAIIILFLKHMFTLSRQGEREELRTFSLGLFAVILGVALASANVRNSFVQPYSGNLFWFLMGAGESLYLRYFEMGNARL